jgi:hypothetical protein
MPKIPFHYMSSCYGISFVQIIEMHIKYSESSLRQSESAVREGN